MSENSRIDRKEYEIERVRNQDELSENSQRVTNLANSRERVFKWSVPAVEATRAAGLSKACWPSVRACTGDRCRSWDDKRWASGCGVRSCRKLTTELAVSLRCRSEFAAEGWIGDWASCSVERGRSGGLLIELEAGLVAEAERSRRVVVVAERVACSYSPFHTAFNTDFLSRCHHMWLTAQSDTWKLCGRRSIALSRFTAPTQPVSWWGPRCICTGCSRAFRMNETLRLRALLNTEQRCVQGCWKLHETGCSREKRWHGRASCSWPSEVDVVAERVARGQVVVEDGVWLRPRAPSGRAESTRTQGPWRPHVGSHQCRGTKVCATRPKNEKENVKAEMKNMVIKVSACTVRSKVQKL